MFAFILMLGMIAALFTGVGIFFGWVARLQADATKYRNLPKSGVVAKREGWEVRYKTKGGKVEVFFSPAATEGEAVRAFIKHHGSNMKSIVSVEQVK